MTLNTILEVKSELIEPVSRRSRYLGQKPLKRREVFLKTLLFFKINKKIIAIALVH